MFYYIISTTYQKIGDLFCPAHISGLLHSVPPKDRLNPNEVKQMFAHKLVRFYYIQPTPKVPNIVTIKKSYQTMYEVNETVSLRQKLNVKMPSNCSI